MARLGDRGSRNESGERDLLRPGTYLLALVWFQRREARGSGKPYLNCKFEVCGGRLQGKSFFTMMSLDLSKPGTVTRWQIWKDACGIEESGFELGGWDDQGASSEDQDAEGDDNIRRLFQGAPFAAEVRQSTQGQYTNNELGQFVFRKNWTDTWHAWADEWLQKRAARSQRAPEDYVGDADEPEPAGGDTFDPYGSAEDDGFEQPRRPPPPPADDDDIPF